MRNYRATAREFNALVAAGEIDPNASDVKLFQEILLKGDEPTPSLFLALVFLSGVCAENSQKLLKA